MSPAGRMRSHIPRSWLGTPSVSVQGKNDLNKTAPALDIHKALLTHYNEYITIIGHAICMRGFCEMIPCLYAFRI